MAKLKQRSECEIVFDHHGFEFARDPIGVFRDARNVCPITWSAAHGGFWLVTGYEEAFAILQDDATYSSAQGVSIPPMPKKGPPIDVDPPLHRSYRRALMPELSVAAVSKLGPQVSEWAREAIDGIAEMGRGDLVLDVAAPVPAKAIMTLLGLELDNWQRYAEVWHDLFAHPLASEVYTKLQLVRVELFDAFQEKRACPADDLMSHLWATDLFGELAQERGASFDPAEEGTDIALTLLGGGVDTTTNLFASSAVWLSAHPVERDRLAADPTLMKSAVDEFLRYFSTAPALARTVTRDVEFCGHDFRAGDRVMVSFMAANHDPTVFDDPDTIQLDRWPNRHMAFGVGVHRCLGSNLARLVFPILLEELLAGLPDYHVVEDEVRVYEDRGQVTGWSRVPCTFTPRPGRADLRAVGAR